MSCWEKPAEWRRERARKAGIASREAHMRRGIEHASRFPTKHHAYAYGYRIGYQAAMRWWKRNYERKDAA